MDLRAAALTPTMRPRSRGGAAAARVTEVARRFSDVLNRVRAGEEIEIVRHGAPVALLSPARARLLPASRLRARLASLPPVDEAFAADLRRLRGDVGPPEDSWVS